MADKSKSAAFGGDYIKREAAKGETAQDPHIYVSENSVNLEGVAMDEGEFAHQQYLLQHPEAEKSSGD